MPFGFQCFDGNGATNFDTATIPGRVVGWLDNQGQQGQLNVPEFSLGHPFFLICSATVPFAQQTENGQWRYPLQVDISGTLLKWTYRSPTGNSSLDRAVIAYGYYP